MNGNQFFGLVCPQCGQATVTCTYTWSGFGDSYDNFQHLCGGANCGYSVEKLGIPGRFPKLTADDWARCPFCDRSSATKDELDQIR